MAREGTKNGRSKLTWELVKRIREQYRKHRKNKWNRNRPGQASEYSILSLAVNHDVSISTMWELLSGRTWKKETTR